MTAAVALGDLQSVLEGSAFDTTVLSVFGSTPEPDAVAGRLASVGEGWLCATDAVYRCRDGRWQQVSGHPAALDVLDPRLPLRLLTAELRVDARCSVHLRRVGTVLQQFRFVEGEAHGEPGETQPVRAEVLCRPHTLCATEGDVALTYRTAWRALPEGEPSLPVWRPWLSRFTGWEMRS